MTLTDAALTGAALPPTATALTSAALTGVALTGAALIAVARWGAGGAERSRVARVAESASNTPTMVRPARAGARPGALEDDEFIVTGNENGIRTIASARSSLSTAGGRMLLFKGFDVTRRTLQG